MLKAFVLLFIATAVPAAQSDTLEQDRRAILAMAGEFEVAFEFDETVALRAGYQLKAPQRAGATELVQVVEDSGKRIVLQHLLVLGDKHEVVKHWRQDWTYETPRVWSFNGHRQWESRELSPEEFRGTWQQSVFEVDDSPRYASVGRWKHVGRISYWTSAETWRPLPRREYTKRNDYDVLIGVNRHTITPDGWVHEQDNLKYDLMNNTGEPMLAREVGRNVYKRTTSYDFSAGREYWRRTADFWASVRGDWQRAMTPHSKVYIQREVEGKPLFESMFDLANRGASVEARDLIRHAVLLEYPPSVGTQR